MISGASEQAGWGETPPGVLRETLRSVRGLADAGARGELRSVDDAALIDMLTDLRRLRATIGALEAEVQAAFHDSQRKSALERGVPRKDAGKGIAEQVALARGVSSYRAANDLALVRGLVEELPATMSRLIDGTVSEHAALQVARETVCLMPEDRAVVDSRVADRVAGVSGRRAAALTRAEAARVDAESVVRRIRQAAKDRCVTVRPAPDAMVYLSALLPVKEGVAAYAALARRADTLQATGDERSRGAIMADTLVARLTGIEHPDRIPVEVQLVMPAATLLPRSERCATAGPGPRDAHTSGGADRHTSSGADPHASRGADAPADPRDDVCGWIGEHPIPPEIAREIALVADEKAQRWVRRLFTDPVSGDITRVDSRRRRFTGATRRAILARDRVCRGCGAPIRHLDHVTAYAADGATSTQNGQGLCERCNQAKALPGWSATAFTIEGRHVTVTRTPTGHRYVSQPPPPTIDPPPRATVSLEGRLQTWIDCAKIDRQAATPRGSRDLVVPLTATRAVRRQ